jgi:hypothetical protein
MRTLIVAAATAALAGTLAVSAQAAPARCEGLIIKSAEIVTDQGQIGVLDSGDVFTVTFRQRFWGIDAPAAALYFTAANGQQDAIFHSNSEFGYTTTSRSVTVTIDEIDLGGGAVDIALPFPVSITRFSGLGDEQGNLFDSTVSACSPDAVLG